MDNDNNEEIQKIIDNYSFISREITNLRIDLWEMLNDKEKDEDTKENILNYHVDKLGAVETMLTSLFLDRLGIAQNKLKNK